MLILSNQFIRLTRALRIVNLVCLSLFLSFSKGILEEHVPRMARESELSLCLTTQFTMWELDKLRALDAAAVSTWYCKSCHNQCTSNIILSHT